MWAGRQQQTRGCAAAVAELRQFALAPPGQALPTTSFPPLMYCGSQVPLRTSYFRFRARSSGALQFRRTWMAWRGWRRQQRASRWRLLHCLPACLPARPGPKLGVPARSSSGRGRTLGLNHAPSRWVLKPVGSGLLVRYASTCDGTPGLVEMPMVTQVQGACRGAGGGDPQVWGLWGLARTWQAGLAPGSVQAALARRPRGLPRWGRGPAWRLRAQPASSCWRRRGRQWAR